MLEIECIEQYSKLRLTLTKKEKYIYEIDEDFIYAKSSIKDVVLTNAVCHLGNDVKQWVFYNCIDHDQFLICDAIRMTLGNGQVIFIDPKFLFGMRIGGINQEECWYKNLLDGSVVNSYIISHW